MAKRKPKSKGLGDTIEKITEATGIKKAVHFIMGEDCGCEARKEKLNQLFPYQNPECLTEGEYLILKDIYAVQREQLFESEAQHVWEIYSRVFKPKYGRPAGCTPCWVRILNELRFIFETYEAENQEQNK